MNLCRTFCPQKSLVLVLVGAIAWMALYATPSVGLVAAQQPTGSVPTVTGTATGPLVKAALTSNVPVYAGPIPGVYPIIGYLVPDQVVPALGRTADSAWIQIVYYGVPDNEGWVYALYLTLVKGNLPPVVATPVPPTPYKTPTMSAGLATLVAGAATPLPTFTSPPPLSIPTFAAFSPLASETPRGVLISLLLAIGLFGVLISFLRRR